MGTFRSQPAHGDRTGVQPISVSVRGARYEAMVLIGAMDWIETELGRWILSADGRRIELETGTSERIA